MIRFRRTWRRSGPDGVVPHLMADVARRAREVSDLDIALWRCIAGDSSDLYRLTAYCANNRDIAHLVDMLATDADLRALADEVGPDTTWCDDYDRVIVPFTRPVRPAGIVCAATVHNASIGAAHAWREATQLAASTGAGWELCDIAASDGPSIEMSSVVSAAGDRPGVPVHPIVAMRWRAAVARTPITGYRWWRRSV